MIVKDPAKKMHTQVSFIATNLKHDMRKNFKNN